MNVNVSVRRLLSRARVGSTSGATASTGSWASRRRRIYTCRQRSWCLARRCARRCWLPAPRTRCALPLKVRFIFIRPLSPSPPSPPFLPFLPFPLSPPTTSYPPRHAGRRAVGVGAGRRWPTGARGYRQQAGAGVGGWTGRVRRVGGNGGGCRRSHARSDGGGGAVVMGVRQPREARAQRRAEPASTRESRGGTVRGRQGR